MLEATAETATRVDLLVNPTPIIPARTRLSKKWTMPSPNLLGLLHTIDESENTADNTSAMTEPTQNHSQAGTQFGGKNAKRTKKG